MSAEDDERVYEGFRKMYRSAFGAGIVAVPVLLLAILDTPVWLSTAFLIVVTIGLAFLVIRQRRQ